MQTLSHGAYVNYEKIINERRQVYYQKGRLNPETLQGFDEIAAKIRRIPRGDQEHLVVNQSVVEIGRADGINAESQGPSRRSPECT